MIMPNVLPLGNGSTFGMIIYQKGLFKTMPRDQFPTIQSATTQPEIAGRLSPGIHYRADKRSWMFVTEQSSYALGITPENLVLHLYWGPRLTSFAGLPEPQLPHERSG